MAAAPSRRQSEQALLDSCQQEVPQELAEQFAAGGSVGRSGGLELRPPLPAAGGCPAQPN
jgi:hypothetical protein